eukprot:jgi/Chrzof1/8851/Cz03g26170.t1
MGTRSGDLDPAIPLHVMQTLGITAKQMDTVLNKKSGLLGVCGYSDIRSVLEHKRKGDEKSALALGMFVYRVQKYIGAYTATLGGEVDAVIFSAGIGENSAIVRSLICASLKGIGIQLDEDKNAATINGKQGDISAAGSKVKVLVVPTDEELSIAQQTLEVVQGDKDKGHAAPAMAA